MFRFRSLTAKFIFISLITGAVLAVYFYVDFRFTLHIKGEAARINIAGRQRMLAAKMMYSAKGILDPLASPAEREEYSSVFNASVNEYEEVLYGLRGGSQKLGLKPLEEHYKDSILQLNALVNLWQKTQKPILLSIKEFPPERRNEACVKCHAAVRGNLKDVDAFVKSLERNHEKEIEDFNALKFSVLGLLLIAAGFIIIYIRQSIIKPVWRLRNATKAIEEGNFDVRTEIKTADEIGILSRTFNDMAQSIGTLFREKTEHLQELDTLNRLSSAIGKSLSVEEIANMALNEILNLENSRMEKKGAIFIADEKKQILNLIAYRGFSGEFAKAEAEVPFGDCLCGIVAETCREIVSDNCFKDERHTRKYPEITEHGHINLPLKSRDKAIGVLALYLPPNTKLLDNEIKLYKSFADIIAVSLQNALNHRQVAMLAQSLDSSIDLIVITDMEGKIIHANPQVMEHIGYTQDELIGMNVSIIQSSMNPSGLSKEIYEKSLEGGWEGEVINIRKDGSEYPVFLTTSPVKDDSGNIVALIGISRDITEQKHAEETIERNLQIQNVLNSLLNVSLEGIPLKELLVKALDIILSVPFLPLMPKGGIFVVEDKPDVLILTANRGFSDQIQAICARVPFGRCLCGRAAASRQIQFADCLDERHENRYDGITPHGHYNVPILSKGKVLGVLVLYLQEGHRQEKSEMEFLQAVINTLAGIIERKRLEDALQKFNEELIEKVKERTSELEDANLRLTALNIEFKLKKEAAEELKFQADTANRAKSDFLANMSHELRTPLNSIIGFSEVIKDGMAGTVTDDQKEYLKDIWESGKHLLRLINDILDLSKVEAGKMELELSEFNVGETIRSCLLLFKEKAMRHSIKLSEDISEGVGNMIADERKIKQVMLNLLGNAFKFTPDRGSVRVSARRTRDEGRETRDERRRTRDEGRRTRDEGRETKDERRGTKDEKASIVLASETSDRPSSVVPRDFVEISVVDTGIGIAPEDMEKLFKPFQQLESVLTKQYEGTGLGLKLCKDFVELHGGRIWAESEVGKGSKFIFIIPIKTTDEG